MISLAAVLVTVTASLQSAISPPMIPMNGDWNFQLDPDNEGIRGVSWLKAQERTVKLPGSLDENAVGSVTGGRLVDKLSRGYEYTGGAWYLRDIKIPESWAGKRVVLFLERCHWETQLWVDGASAGLRESLCAPHIYDLGTSLKPGSHRFALRVDNTVKYNVGKDAHSITDHTQTNWNGVIGRVELQATEPVWIDSLSVTPHVAAKSVDVKFSICNATQSPCDGHYVIEVSRGLPPVKGEFSGVPSGGRQDESVTVPLGPKAEPWDEFSPELYELAVKVSAECGGATCEESSRTNFGLREVGTNGSRITVNGRPTFLRGNLECCIFPKTGYPSMDVDAWLRMFRTAHEYGLNHVRFHSWCPPEAAFEAADQLGIMLHVETPVWTTLGSDEKLDQFVYDESDRILATYGNHPSFCMLAVGNEPNGEHKDEFLKKIVAHWKEKDPRRLYTTCSGWPELPGSDYHVVHARNGMPFRLHGGPLGPSTNFDYAKCLEGADAPLVAHELGQWCVYPNYEEIGKYTGLLHPRNLETFRDALDANHMLAQDAAFSKASGKLQTVMYKADIEAMLRTPGAAGFQLLSLQDFPGQGSALVGFLDALWGSKGYTLPYEFREFCSETVPLLRFDRHTWSTADTFHAEAEIAHFGKTPIAQAVLQWSITSPDGRVLADGTWNVHDIPTGNGTKLGPIDLRLADVKGPVRLTVTISLKDSAFRNHWDIWVYPGHSDVAIPETVRLAESFDGEVEATLEKGGTVLLYPSFIAGRFRVASAFEPIFWNTQWFPKQDRQLGVLCDPAHPALRLFPNRGYTDWQWWDVLNKSSVINLDACPQGLHPIVQVIDDWNKNRKLGAVFEAKIGSGKLVVCALTGGADSLAGIWLRNSLVQYAGSADCNPVCEMDLETVRQLFAKPATSIVRMDETPPLSAPLALARSGERH